MPNFNPIIRGQQFKFSISLRSQADGRVFQSNPTLASVDVKITKDGGAPANLTTLPTCPNADTEVVVTVSAAEMDADVVSILFKDASGAQWCDRRVTIHPSGLGLAGTVNADGSQTTTGFKTSLTGLGDDFFNNAFILFTDGSLQGMSRKISDYASTNGVVTLATALPAAPANATPFLILGRSE